MEIPDVEGNTYSIKPYLSIYPDSIGLGDVYDWDDNDHSRQASHHAVQACSSIVTKRDNEAITLENHRSLSSDLQVVELGSH